MYGTPITEQLRIAFEQISATAILALLFASLLISFSGLGLLLASLRQMSRAKGGLPGLAVIVLEAVGGFMIPVLAYGGLSVYLERFGGGMPLMFMSFLWCPASFLMGLVTVVNVVLTLQAVRAGRLDT